jgi:hypothetical protein
MLARRHGVTALAHTWISSCVDLTSAVSPTAAKEQTFCKVSSVPVPGKCAAPETALRRPAPQIPPTLGAIPNAGGAISPMDTHAELENSEMRNARATSQ